MPESKLIRYLSHAQALRLRAHLEHAIAMARADLEALPGVDPRGVEAELGMLLVRLAVPYGVDLTDGAGLKLARLEAELEQVKIGPAPRDVPMPRPPITMEVDPASDFAREARRLASERDAVDLVRAANGHAVRFADGSHQGNELVAKTDPYVAAAATFTSSSEGKALREAGYIPHQAGCKCSACRGNG